MWKNRLKEKLKNEKGFMSIEAIMGMATILMVILLGIGFFTYMMPRQAIEEEVHLTGRLVKMQGGLTAIDVQNFQENMKKRGMVTDENKDDVVVKLILEDTAGNQRGEFIPGSAPIQRGETYNDGTFKVMKLLVEVPANTSALDGAMSFFGGGDGLSDKHVFSERIMSEYYGG